jgi:hypothetical protein
VQAGSLRSPDHNPANVRESPRRSSFFGVMQVHPGLNIIAIRPAKSFLSRVQIRAAGVSPATFGNERIPDLDFFIARLFAVGKAPVENFFVRPAL